jgi:cysteine synthase B
VNLSVFEERIDRRSTLIDLVGNTPLLRLARIDPDLPPGVAVYAKAEWYNPGGSVKDRPALWMIRDGERRGPRWRTTRFIASRYADRRCN